MLIKPRAMAALLAFLALAALKVGQGLLVGLVFGLIGLARGFILQFRYHLNPDKFPEFHKLVMDETAKILARDGLPPSDTD